MFDTTANGLYGDVLNFYTWCLLWLLLYFRANRRYSALLIISKCFRLVFKSTALTRWIPCRFQSYFLEQKLDLSFCCQSFDERQQCLRVQYHSRTVYVIYVIVLYMLFYVQLILFVTRRWIRSKVVVTFLILRKKRHFLALFTHFIYLLYIHNFLTHIFFLFFIYSI